MEGPIIQGTPPLQKNTKAGHAEANRLIIERGAETAVTDGLIHLKDYIRIRNAVGIYKQVTSSL